MRGSCSFEAMTMTDGSFRGNGAAEDECCRCAAASLRRGALRDEVMGLLMAVVVEGRARLR